MKKDNLEAGSPSLRPSALRLKALLLEASKHLSKVPPLPEPDESENHQEDEHESK